MIYRVESLDSGSILTRMNLQTLMSNSVVRSKAIVLKKRICRGCGTTLKPPRWLCSRCEVADASVSSRRLADTV